jgi:MFS family permease
MVAKLIPEVGFGWTMRICAFLIFVLLLISIATVHPFQPPVPHKITKAELMKPFTEMEFLLIAASYFCFTYGFFVPVDFLQVEALDAGMSAKLAQYLLSIFNAGSLFGRLIAGLCGDIIGSYNTYIVVCFLSGVWVFALWIPASNDATVIAFSILFGFFSGAFVSLLMPLMLKSSPLKEIGFRTGIVMLVFAVAGLTANPINGVILDGSSGWLGVKIWAGVFCIAGSTLMLAARLRMTGLKLLVQF